MESQPSFEAPEGADLPVHDPNAAPGAPRDEPGSALAPPPHRRREPLRAADGEWRRAGLRTAAVAAAATAGVVVRFGVASGAGAFGAFQQTGRLALGVTRADGTAAHVAATLVGLMVHTLLVTFWSLAYARVTAGRGAFGRWVAAFAIAALVWTAQRFLLPEMLHLGHGARALPQQLALLHVVLALSLAVGMRLALEPADEH